jgi:hypothetical protein
VVSGIRGREKHRITISFAIVARRRRAVYGKWIGGWIDGHRGEKPPDVVSEA